MSSATTIEALHITTCKCGHEYLGEAVRAAEALWSHYNALFGDEFFPEHKQEEFDRFASIIDRETKCGELREVCKEASKALATIGLVLVENNLATKILDDPRCTVFDGIGVRLTNALALDNIKENSDGER